MPQDCPGFWTHCARMAMAKTSWPRSRIATGLQFWNVPGAAEPSHHGRRTIIESRCAIMAHRAGKPVPPRAASGNGTHLARKRATVLHIGIAERESGEPCRTVRDEGNQRLALANRKIPPLDLIGLFGPLANRFRDLRNRKAADRAGTRVNGQIEKFALTGYQIAPVIAIAGGADV